MSAPGDATAPLWPDARAVRAVCDALGFDPTNHHNAARCPYCTPEASSAPATPCDCERGHNGLGVSGRECDCAPAEGLGPEAWESLSDDLAALSSYVGAGLPDRVDPATIAGRIREGIDILTSAQFEDAQCWRALGREAPSPGAAARGPRNPVGPVLAWEEGEFRAYNRAFDFHVARIGEQFVLQGPLSAGGSFPSMDAAKDRAQTEFDARLSACSRHRDPSE